VRLKTNILVPICKNALKYSIGAGSKIDPTPTIDKEPFKLKNNPLGHLCIQWGLFHRNHNMDYFLIILGIEHKSNQLYRQLATFGYT